MAAWKGRHLAVFGLRKQGEPEAGGYRLRNEANGFWVFCPLQLLTP